MTDEYYMKKALEQAKRAADMGEVPVGAVIVYEDRIIARGYNLREKRKDPTAHAEMIAISRAAKKLGSWRLTGCTLYVTLEPCPMCAGALVNARIDRLVYGADDPKAGYCKSLYHTPQDKRLNHRCKVTSGVLQTPCAQILRDFFAQRRKIKKEGSLEGFS